MVQIFYFYFKKNVNSLLKESLLFWFSKNYQHNSAFIINSHLAHIQIDLEFPWGLSGKEPACQGRRPGFDPWVGKIPGGENGNPLQYPWLQNPMDRGARWATVHGAAESDMTECTLPNTHTHTHTHTQIDLEILKYKNRNSIMKQSHYSLQWLNMITQKHHIKTKKCISVRICAWRTN